MDLWLTVLIASAISFATKFLGYVVPQSALDHPLTDRVMRYLPVALLSALIAVQALTTGSGDVTIDARAAGLGVAICCLFARAPFLVVVIAAAATAAVLRAFGVG
ncbi:AzlD domain-containing protein [Flexivirga sp. ID2601S]|uniref:AzlD domain-containing protein n=1 Tax=Flexivirga aerilata TaxID=1656889 RepID=A0A849AGG4_9MICO|nr:AzlD domain-containing protein [Flexivirga aerilata]NNG39499.1 AzlD domain-containing protein [Flexivirga aerilata]